LHKFHSTHQLLENVLQQLNCWKNRNIMPHKNNGNPVEFVKVINQNPFRFANTFLKHKMPSKVG